MNMKEFEMRSYSKSELALLYFPTCQRRCAVRMLMKWIERVPGLKDRLRDCGYQPCDKVLLTQMVRLIVGALGEP